MDNENIVITRKNGIFYVFCHGADLHKLVLRRLPCDFTSHDICKFERVGENYSYVVDGVKLFLPKRKHLWWSPTDDLVTAYSFYHNVDLKTMQVRKNDLYYMDVYTDNEDVIDFIKIDGVLFGSYQKNGDHLTYDVSFYKKLSTEDVKDKIFSLISDLL